MTDRASAEGLREAKRIERDARLHDAIDALEAAVEWMRLEPHQPMAAQTFYNKARSGLVGLRTTLRSSDSDSGIDVERLAEAMRPLFDGPESVHLERLGWWEDDLLALTRRDIAVRVARLYARLSTPRTETPDAE